MAITVALGTCLGGNLEYCVYVCVVALFVPRTCEVLTRMAGNVSTNSVLTSHGHPVWFLPVWQWVGFLDQMLTSDMSYF